MTFIEELREVIRKLRGVDSSHRASVPVKEVFNGKTVWEGIVEVLTYTATTRRMPPTRGPHATYNPAEPKWHVTVLHIPPAVSPETAVRAAILQELRGLDQA